MYIIFFQPFLEGPYATKYNFLLYPDLRTVTDVDLGQLGGKTDATAEIKGNTMITYLRKKGKRNVFMTAKRTINPGKVCSNILLDTCPIKLILIKPFQFTLCNVIVNINKTY